MNVPIDEMLAWPVSKLIKWVDKADSMPAESNFVGLAFGAQSIALMEGEVDIHVRLVYARVALEAWRMYRAATIGRVEPVRDETILSEVVLRSELLTRFTIQNDATFGQDVLMSLIDAEIASVDSPVLRGSVSTTFALEDADLSTVRELRRIKNVLRSAQRYIEMCTENLTAECRWWWDRQHLLP